MRKPLSRRKRAEIAQPAVTYNAGNASDAKLYADLERLALGSEAALLPVILLQEVADRATVLTRFAHEYGYTLHQETRDDKGHVAVLIPPRMKIVARGYWRCTKRTPVGAWGAGPSTIAAKWIAWVTVEIGGRLVTFASTHFVPSVERKAHGKVAVAARARRWALYARHVAGIVAWLPAVRGAKVLGYDGNARAGFRLLEPLRRLIVRTAASHGKRAIDMIRVTLRLWLKVGPARALNGFSSDHRPVVVVLTIRVSRRFRRGSGR